MLDESEELRSSRCVTRVPVQTAGNETYCSPSFKSDLLSRPPGQPPTGKLHLLLHCPSSLFASQPRVRKADPRVNDVERLTVPTIISKVEYRPRRKNFQCRTKTRKTQRSTINHVVMEIPNFQGSRYTTLLDWAGWSGTGRVCR